WLGRAELAPLAAPRLAAALGRDVAIESLRVAPGRWLRVELRGLGIGNVAGGTRPEMLRLRRTVLELDLLSLLHGPPVLRGVTAEGVSLLLERGAGGARNWRFGPPRPAEPGPVDRSGLPLLLDARLAGSELLFRTGSGALLHLRLDDAALAAAEAAAPIALRAAGAYNDVPVALDATLGSTAELRLAGTPWRTLLRLASGGTTLDVDGRMTDPLDLDGLAGRAMLRAPSPEALLALGGAADAAFDGALALDGTLTRQGPTWRLADATGTLAGEPVTVRLAQFTEGQPGQPDAVALDLGLGRLDLNRRLAAGARRGAAEADLPLAVSLAPDPLLSARLTADELVYAGLEARDVEFRGRLEPGRIAVETFALGTSGARLRAAGAVTARPAGAAIAAEVRLEEGDLDRLRRAFGLRDLPLSGRLDGWVAVTAAGERLNEAAAGARISAVVAMREGQVAREVVEMGSTDIRLLLRRPRGSVPVGCLLGMLEITAGRGEVAPLRLRAATGTIAGSASVDLDRRVLDLVIGSVRSTTGVFALDIPVRVSGGFANPRIRPARWSSAGRARLAAADAVAPLPARLQEFARANPCFQAGATPASPPRAAPPRTTSRSRRR
ncbi:hypothetical protein E2C05_27305, partial [Paracraurococcus ruber]